MRRTVHDMAVALALVALSVAAAPLTTAAVRTRSGAITHATHLAPPQPARRTATAASAQAASSAPAGRTADTDDHRVLILPVSFFDPFFFDPFWGPVWAAGWYGPFWPSPWWYGPQAPQASASVQAALGDRTPVTWHVHPWKATLTIDGRTAGEARDFNDPSHPLAIEPGRHAIELSYPGYRTLKLDLSFDKGQAYDLRYRLRKGEGTDTIG